MISALAELNGQYSHIIHEPSCYKPNFFENQSERFAITNPTNTYNVVESIQIINMFNTGKIVEVEIPPHKNTWPIQDRQINLSKELTAIWCYLQIKEMQELIGQISLKEYSFLHSIWSGSQ